MENSEFNIYHEISDNEMFDKPIDYVKLNESDFLGLDFSKEYINIPSGKYLSDVIKPDFYRDNICNTIAINSAVGEGKSSFVIKVAKNYVRPQLERPNTAYTVIFAVPYKSLIRQYISLIKKELKDYKIPDYNNLIDLPYRERQVNSKEASSPNNINYGKSCRIHVMTINCLLGNPGEDFIEQSLIKRKYVEGIIDYAKSHGRKIILIFDEIHAGIKNFRQELIYNLWKFKTSNILHKNFILSATFNEASKTVINYLAELTDKKLHIYESIREQKEEYLSNLHLFLTNKRNSKYDSDEYIELFKRIIKEHQHFDILTSFKDTAIKLAQLFQNNPEIKSLIRAKWWHLNLCIAEDNYQYLDEKQFEDITMEGRYLEDHCNIGTTFNTGISIEHEHSAFVIILPAVIPNSENAYNNNLGIFTEGIIPLIQSLARVRKQSDIYVIMPIPTELIIPNTNDLYNSYIHKLPDLPILQDLKDDNIEKNLDYYSEYSEIAYEEQAKLIDKKYDLMYRNVQKEIELVEEKKERKERENLPFLRYPSKDEFILKWGEKLLYSKFAIFGKDLPAYILWASFNNQFVNCRLKTVIGRSPEEVDMEEGYLHDYLYERFEEIYSSEKHISKLGVCDYTLYKDFEKHIFSNKIMWGNNHFPIYKSNISFQKHLIAFFQKAIKGNKRLYNKYYQQEQSGHVLDIPFEAQDYLMCCMANALIYQNEELTANSKEKKLIKAYQNLYIVFQYFQEKVVFVKEDGKKYIYSNFDSFFQNPFTNLESDFIINTISNIMEDDYYKVFRKFISLNLNNKDEALNKIFKELKKTFFIKTGGSHITKSIPDTDQTRNINIDYINIVELPQKRTGINLLYKYDYKYGSGENYDSEVWNDKFIYIDKVDEMGTTTLSIDEVKLTQEAKDILYLNNSEE